MQKNEKRPDRYALVGHPVAHSRSPLIHQLFARQLGHSLTYELIDAEPHEFEVAVRGFGAAGGKGMNVTIPHKEAAFELCDETGPEAQEAHAVNTISFEPGGRLRGDNTDGIGLIRDLTVNQQQSLADKRVLVLGAGGAARGIVAPVAGEGPAEIVVANRTKERAEELVGLFRGRVATPLSVLAFSELDTSAPFDVVFNATSAGLKGEPPPFPATIVGPETFCYDLVYGLKDTPFVVWARQHGARAAQGFGMLVEQAAESYYIWRGVRPDTEPLLRPFLGTDA